MTNLALGKTATSTRTDFGATVQAGVDGNRDGNFAHGSVFYENATPVSQPILQVDLGQNDYINRFQFMPAPMPLRTSLHFIFRSTPTTAPVSLRHPVIFQNYNSSYFGGHLSLRSPQGHRAGGANGRFVRMSRLDNNFWLTFAEMEVIGSSAPLQYTQGSNIAAVKR